MARTQTSGDSQLWKNLLKAYQDDKVVAAQAARLTAQEAVLAAFDEQRQSVVFSRDAVLAASIAQQCYIRQIKQHQSDHRNDNGIKSGKQPRSGSMDLSDDQSSFLSIERGVCRGSKRGLFEENEVRFTHDQGGDVFSLSAAPERDITTIAESRISAISAPVQRSNAKLIVSRKANLTKKRKISSIFKRDSLLGLRNNFTQISKEAWMCGICAKSFSSFEAAQKHEDYHIKEVVMELGWLCNPTSILQRNFPDPLLLTMPPLPDCPTSSVENRSQVCSYAVDLSSPVFPSSSPDVTNTLLSPRPDVLTMSKRNFTPRNSPPSDPHPNQNGISDTEYFATAREPFTSSFAPVRYEPINDFRESTEYDLLVPHGMREYMVLADEALTDVCNKAQKLILTFQEKEAEYELSCYSKDKDYYDVLERRQIERKRDGAYSRFRTEGKNIAEKVQNKFVDAYALMKEGKSKETMSSVDHYKRILKGDDGVHNVINNTKDTLYVNVIVKNSLQVVSHELERLARLRWEEYKSKSNENERINKDSRNEEGRAQFEKFKAAAQGNLVKLAGFALASDFTPRRIAVQLSNDLYRLLSPRLKRRGIYIETEIEYRVGAYFVLAVNVLRVDWRKLVKTTHRDVSERRSKWIKDSESEDAKEKVTRFYGPIANLLRLSRMTSMEILGQFVSLLYFTHWAIYTPICMLLYHFGLGEMFRKYFLSSVTDEIFYYVERKGMEMEIRIKDAQDQTAFMLMALKEIRADGRELKKKQEKSVEDEEADLIGPILGPAIKEDNGPAPAAPDGFELPDNLEFVGLEVSLQVGFRRLRWALLSSQSSFMTEGVWKAESNYDNITVNPWNKHDAEIGAAKLPDDVKEESLIGAERECSYLMPKSAFVAANMAFETSYIEAYNEYCFCYKNKALTPDVPYGSTFEAWTKYIIINTGKNSCKMICSVEAAFPNGPPMISRQIKSAMRAGVAELFVKTGETIQKYANAYP